MQQTLSRNSEQKTKDYEYVLLNYQSMFSVDVFSQERTTTNLQHKKMIKMN